MASLIDLNRKIAKLQKQADAIKSREKKGVIERIRQAILHYDLTVADLFSESAAPVRRGRRAAASAAGVDVLSKSTGLKPRRGRPVGAVSRKPVPIRYRDEEGNTWTGRGKQPNWLKRHIENGRNPEDFLLEHEEGGH
ncbi:MAG: H-NS histone family protein [Lautropia sp.]|nr:H-NS histone family protein [Lautropia sp.]